MKLLFLSIKSMQERIRWDIEKQLVDFSFVIDVETISLFLLFFIMKYLKSINTKIIKKQIEDIFFNLFEI